MPRLVTERISRYRYAPRRKADPPGGQRISYLSQTSLHGEPGEHVKEVFIPPYAWPAFIRNRRLHFIQSREEPFQVRIGVGGQLLRTPDLPTLTWIGRIRLLIWWNLQKLWGNV